MNESNVEDTPPAATREQPGWDAMLEDLLGLNIRGLRTIGVIFISPQKVYAAARAENWLERAYTPSLRLFISLVMLVLVLQAFWAGPESRVTAVQITAIKTQLEMSAPPELQPFIDPLLIWQNAIVSLPIATVSIMLVFAFLLRIWGKGVNAVTRVRFYFLSVIPAWIISFLLSMGSEILPNAIALTVIVLNPFIILSIDAISAWRGNPGQYQKFARIWRSALFAATNQAVYFLAGIVMFIYATNIALAKAAQAAEAAGVILTGS